LDYGDQGGARQAAARAFQWWSDHYGKRCERWPVPNGKDPGEAYQLGVDLKRWIEAGLPPILTISHEPKPMVGKSTKSPNIQHHNETLPPHDAPEPLKELWNLLRSNPGREIINTKTRFTVTENERYVGAASMN